MNKGDVFAIDIGVAYRQAAKALHGKFIVAWCYGPAGKMGSGEPMHRFAVGDALFARKPTLAEVRKRKLGIQILTNRYPPAGVSAVYDNPDGEERCATLLGTLSKVPTLTPKHIRQREWGRWGNMALDFNFHWRELHDAVALKKARDAEDAKDRKAAAVATKKRRAGGLAGMKRRTLAADLTGLISKARATATRNMLKGAITELLATPRATRATKESILKSAVEKLNEYDAKQRGFIETPEREALMTCLEDIAVASGLGELTEKLTDWRDW